MSKSQPLLADVQPEKFEHVACYLCGADDAKTIVTKRGRTVVQCRHCGLIYTDPRPKNETLFNEVYDVTDKYRRKTERVTKPGRLITYRRFLKKVAPFRKTNRILEIGSGFGYFLNEAKEQGWQPLGVEISPFSTDYARKTYGVECLTGTLEEHFETLKQQEPFDVVALWNVFEHLPDPVASMKMFRELLRPGGAVVIKVPDARVLTLKPNLLQRLWLNLYIHRFFPLHAHMHIVHLTPESFGELARSTGYDMPQVFDDITPAERPTRNWRQALRHRWHIALHLPYNFVAIAVVADRLSDLIS
jgi:2-polyprenyl-3-methyl-5-hydroxy-6-metoxy-1,4-benzoquinol methylase